MNAVISMTYWLTRLLFLAGAAAVLLMMVHIGVDVASRAVLGRPTFGMVETVTNYYMIAVCFLPIAFVQVQGGHLTVEAFTMGFPKTVIRAITVAGLLLAATIAALLTWHSGVSAMERTKAGEYIDITIADFPIWPARWMLALGYGAVFLTLCLQILLTAAGRPLPGQDSVNG